MYRRAPDAALSATSLPRADGLTKPPRRSTAGRDKLAPAADRGVTTTIGKNARAGGQSAFETQKSLDSDDRSRLPPRRRRREAHEAPLHGRHKTAAFIPGASWSKKKTVACQC